MQKQKYSCVLKIFCINYQHLKYSRITIFKYVNFFFLVHLIYFFGDRFHLHLVVDQRNICSFRHQLQLYHQELAQDMLNHEEWLLQLHHSHLSYRAESTRKTKIYLVNGCSEMLIIVAVTLSSHSSGFQENGYSTLLFIASINYFSLFSRIQINLLFFLQDLTVFSLVRS